MTTNKRWPIFALGLAVGIAAAFLGPRIMQRHNSMSSNETPAASGKGRILYYRNPMHPEITSPMPTQDDMSMDYIPVYEGDEGQESPVSGHAVVKLPKWRQQLIGIKTTEAVRKPLQASIRTVGRIAYDPDLYTAMTEYKEALLSREKVKDSTWPDVLEGANALVKASAMKLKLMGLGDRQIEDLAKEKAPTNLLAGQAGGTVWVYAEVNESDAGLVSAGQAVEVTLPALPGQTLHGTIKAVDPVLNPTTRTLRVRAEIPDERGQLKPEMFANVSIKIPLGERLAVPSDAVFDTGERQLVFVEIAEGEFDPREVKVGHLADGFYEILSGLKPGEKIVTQANFLLDSESKLRATGLKASQRKKP
jgi:Cu(I)/Ag(I) efflux system membrane fusion protein